MSEPSMSNQTKNGEDLFINNADVPQIIVITVILSIFSVVGTTGNAFVLYVFSRKKDKNTSTIFILALAVIDFLTCLCVIPFTIYVEFRHKKIDSDILCKLYQFLITSNVPFSAFIMVAIAFDRYFCICRPWIKCIDVKRAKRIILSLFVFAVSLGLITCLAYGVYQQPGTSNTTEFNQSSQRILNCNVMDFDSGFSGNYNSSLPRVISCSTSTEQNPTNISVTDGGAIFEYTGFCYPNEVIMSRRIRKIYHGFYVSLFFFSFITVFVLYGLIYKSLLTRRAKRLRTSTLHRHKGGRRSTLLSSVFTRQSDSHEKSSAEVETLNNQQNEQTEGKAQQLSPVIKYTNNLTVPTEMEENKSVASVTLSSMDASMMDMTEQTSTDVSDKPCSNTNENTHTRPKGYTRKNKITNTRFKDNNIERKHSSDENNGDNKKSFAINIYRKDTRKSVREKHLLANIKTAGILFIVTLVFILAFLPSWLMAIKIIPVNMIVFYMYFSYNVANPVIYAFFNNTFQKEVRHMLKCSA